MKKVKAPLRIKILIQINSIDFDDKLILMINLFPSNSIKVNN